MASGVSQTASLVRFMSFPMVITELDALSSLVIRSTAHASFVIVQRMYSEEPGRGTGHCQPRCAFHGLLLRRTDAMVFTESLEGMKT